MADLDDSKEFTPRINTLIWTFFALWLVASSLQISATAVLGQRDYFSSSICDQTANTTATCIQESNKYLCEFVAGKCSAVASTTTMFILTMVCMIAIVVPLILFFQVTCCGSSRGQIYRANQVLFSTPHFYLFFILLTAWAVFSCIVFASSDLSLNFFIGNGIIASLVWLTSGTLSNKVEKRETLYKVTLP